MSSLERICELEEELRHQEAIYYDISDRESEERRQVRHTITNLERTIREEKQRVNELCVRRGQPPLYRDVPPAGQQKSRRSDSSSLCVLL